VTDESWRAELRDVRLKRRRIAREEVVRKGEEKTTDAVGIGVVL
jgi:hypothetical protein